MHTVALLVNGELHAGFMKGSLVRSMNAPASSFDLEYSATATETDRVWPIEEGDPCEVRIDDKTVITGFVDTASTGEEGRTLFYRAAGRSRVGDLVDCACVHTPRTWNDATLARIAQDIVDPFACNVAIFGDSNRAVGRRARARAAVPAGAGQQAQAAQRAMSTFRYQVGEGALEVLRRAAALRGMFLFDSPDGDLVIARVGADDAGVTLGPVGTVLKRERSGDWSRRFSEYRFVGQSHARDDLPGTAGTQLSNVVNDPTLQQRGRFRPTVVTKKGGGGREDIGAASVLARNKAAGQSETVSYTVPGWHDGHGEPWSVGYLVDVDDERLRVRGKMVVVSATFRFGPREPWNTALELAWPEAFDEIDYPTRGRGAVWS